MQIPSLKLGPRQVGPFKITRIVNPVAFQLELPSHWKKHNVFHVLLLTPFKGKIESTDLEKLNTLDNQEFEVKAVLKKRRQG